MDADTQDDLLVYIEAQLQTHAQRHPSPWSAKETIRQLLYPAGTPLLPPTAVDSLEQIGLLLRKLRESYTASRRAFCVTSPPGDSERVDASVMRAYLLSIFISLLVWNVSMLHTSLQTTLDLLLPVLSGKGSVLEAPGQEQLQTDIQHMMGLERPFTSVGIPFDSRSRLTDWIASLKVLLDAVSLMSSSVGAVGRQSKANRAEQLQAFAFWRNRLADAEWLSVVEPVARAIRTSNPLILGARAHASPLSTSLAHACLLHHAISPLRSRAWFVVQRAFVSVPLPRRLAGHASQGDGWLDRIFLTDPEGKPDPLTAFLQTRVPNAPATGPGTAALPPALMKALPSTLTAWDSQHRLSVVRVGQATHLKPEQWNNNDGQQVLLLRIR